MKKIYNKHNI